MGCFLGCFGLSSKRKRRTSIKRILLRDQRLGSYEPLQSSVLANLDVTEDPENLDSKLGYEPKEKAVNKIKKKVRFNLNVQSYEPIPKTYETIFSDEEETEEARKKELFISAENQKPEDSNTRSYPSNYRYKNCIDSYEEEDEIANGESDLDEDEYYYTDDEDEDEAEDEAEAESDVDEKIRDQEMRTIGSNRIPPDRSQIVSPVLKPVVNLAHWKQVKVKMAKPQRKENVAVTNTDQSKPLLQEIAVDTSLSSWLPAPKNCDENVPLKRSLLSERAPILDITNLGNR